MKITNRPLTHTADISSARGTLFQESWKLILSAIVLLIVLYTIAGLTVDTVVNRVSFETEARLFRFIKIPEAEPKGPDQLERLQAVRGILKKLIAEEDVPPLPYTLVLIDKDDPNAFAFPGGTIGVTSGLVDSLSDDIEIAFVIGHELGHFRNKDHLRSMGRAIGFSILTGAVFGGSINANQIGNVAELVAQRRYSQELERRADKFGIRLVHSAYNSLKGTQRLFEILAGQERLPQ